MRLAKLNAYDYLVLKKGYNREMIKAPIILYEWGDIIIFDSEAHLAREIEPWYVDDGESLLFDSEGRFLEAYTAGVTSIVVRPATSESRFTQQLTNLLVRFIEWSKMGPAVGVNLDELVQAAGLRSRWWHRRHWRARRMALKLGDWLEKAKTPLILFNARNAGTLIFTDMEQLLQGIVALGLQYEEYLVFGSDGQLFEAHTANETGLSLRSATDESRFCSQLAYLLTGWLQRAQIHTDEGPDLGELIKAVTAAQKPI